jgi:hypothetical protein
MGWDAKKFEIVPSRRTRSPGRKADRAKTCFVCVATKVDTRANEKKRTDRKSIHMSYLVSKLRFREILRYFKGDFG